MAVNLLLRIANRRQEETNDVAPCMDSDTVRYCSPDDDDGHVSRITKPQHGLVPSSSTLNNTGR